MPRLEIEISASEAGLKSSAARSLGILANLQKAADNLKIELFSATDVQQMNAIGGALTTITNQIKNYTDEAIKGSAAWQDQQSLTVLNKLDQQLKISAGNAQLFGQTVKNQQGELRAYQRAINDLLRAGLSPMDSRVLKLKNSVDQLNAALAVKPAQTNIGDQFKKTGNIITDLENRVKRLREALRTATNTRQIASYNIRLRETQQELKRLNSLGLQSTNTIQQTGNQAVHAANGFNHFGLEMGRVVQDLPYAANNFGAIGNNITRMVEVLPGYVAQLRATMIAQGQVVTSSSLMRAAFTSMFTGINGWIIGISAVVTALTIIIPKIKAAREEAEEITDTFRTLGDFMKEAEEGFRAEAAALDILRRIAEDANLPLEDRLAAVQKMRNEYPDYLKNFSDEEILAGEAANAYTRLAGALNAAATARAYQDAAIEVAKQRIQTEASLAKTIQERLGLERELAKPLPEVGDPNADVEIYQRKQLKKQIEDLQATERAYRAQLRKESEQQIKYSDEVYEALKKADGAIKEFLDTDGEDPLKPVRDSLEKINTDAIRIGSNVAEGFLKGFKEAEKGLQDSVANAFKHLSPEDFASVFRDAQVGNLPAIEILPRFEIKGGPGVVNAGIREELEKQLAQLGPLFGGISLDQISQQAINQGGDTLARTQAIIDSLRTMKEVAFEVADTFGDMYASLIVDGEDAFDTINRMFKRLVKQMISELISSGIKRLFASLLTGGVGAGGGFLKGIFGGLFGAANGAVVSGYTPIAVGDYPGVSSNPEVIAPLSDLKKYIGEGGAQDVVVHVKGEISNEVIYLAGQSGERKYKRFYGR